MLRKVDRRIIFIVAACLAGIMAGVGFELLVNKIFPQPEFNFCRTRFLAIILMVASAICLVRFRLYFLQNLHKAFLLIAAAFGIAFVLVFPRTVYLSPDDQIHFKNAYFMTYGTVELKGGFSAIESAGFTNVSGKGFDEMSVIYDGINKANDVVVDAQYTIDETPHLYSRIVYLPFHIGLRLSDFLGLSFTASIAIAKICNLACYIALVYLAIRESGAMRKLFFVIGLLMGNIFLVTQFSYDPLVVASLLLAISLFLHIRQSKSVSTKYLMGFVIAVVFGSLTKAIYCPLLLLVLLIPKEKFDCKERAIVYKVCALIVMIILASTFVLPILSGGLAGDIRGGNTSVSGQILYLISNPLRGSAIIMNYLAGQLPDTIFGTGSLVQLGYPATHSPIYFLCLPVMQLVWVMSLLLLLRLTFQGSLSDLGLTNKSKVGLAIIYTVLAGGVIASMYLSFTPVGSHHIDGVQPRYFMPFFPLLLLLLMPADKLKRKNSTHDYLTLFVPCACLALVLMTYILRVSIL